MKDYALLYRVGLALMTARLRFSRRSAEMIFDTLNSQSENDTDRDLTLEDRDYIAQLSWMTPAISRRLPWRSDCTIQAMAAQDLLSKRDLPSSISVGARKDEEEGFLAHAWLTCHGICVTGLSQKAFSEFNRHSSTKREDI